jgi:hypothetical protein
MFKSAAARMITAVVAAAFVAGLAIFLTAVVPDAKAESAVQSAGHETGAKADRHPTVVKGAACSLQSWPNYEQSCEFDLRRPIGGARTVRVIALR